LEEHVRFFFGEMIFRTTSALLGKLGFQIV
jgi:hypothetical protein